MNESERFNAYRIMWLMVYFDLPTETKADRKLYATFRKNLLKAGFTMFQYSVYIRHCMSREHADRMRKGIKAILPPKGHVVISNLTDKQFQGLEVYQGKSSPTRPPAHQSLMLEFF
ncbi:MAG: CRISPR-associated endonuclease Cas2 [Saprospiraceae bacterium]|jgi:CRISPR-associated protein Cas2|nr:CRISPR-associated endonuclease Cas2 [Saprospiraceae bacterium]MBV6472286.1 CRISPR-associated endoribonuclease Cas2 [Saprospiraceae bacterium]